MSVVTFSLDGEGYLSRMIFLYKNRFALFGVLIGAVGGYIYWYFWGCTEGCTIQSVWWRMSTWGAIMGGLLFSMVKDAFEKRAQRD